METGFSPCASADQSPPALAYHIAWIFTAYIAATIGLSALTIFRTTKIAYRSDVPE